MIRSRIIGILLALTGVVLFSAKAVMVKLAYQYPVDALTVLLFRMLFALPFYIAIAMYKRPKIPEAMTPRVYVWIVFLGVVGYYLASLFDFMGLVYIKASLERIILFIYPTIVLVLYRLFFKQRMTYRQLLAIVLTYLGIVLAFWSEVSLDSDALLWGGGLIFLSAITYASYIVGSGWLIPKIGATVFTSYAMIVSCSCVILHYGIMGDFALWDFPREVYYLGVAMAIFSTVLPTYIVSASIKMIGAPTFAIVASFGPISTILLASYFLGESINSLQWMGTGLVLVGVFFVTKKD